MRSGGGPPIAVARRGLEQVAEGWVEDAAAEVLEAAAQRTIVVAACKRATMSSGTSIVG
jgi:hypothetical protein